MPPSFSALEHHVTPMISNVSVLEHRPELLCRKSYLKKAKAPYITYLMKSIDFLWLLDKDDLSLLISNKRQSWLC